MRVTSDGKTESAYTYRRLPDEDGHARIELRVDFTAGPFQGTWSKNQYFLGKDFRLEDDALSFSRHCVRLLMQSDKMDQMQEMDAATLPNIVAAGIDYAASVKFTGTESIEGRDCDHYTYHYVSTEQNSTTYDGELWMNASVPFGLVRESASLKSQMGPPSKYSMTLVATGTDTGGAAAPGAASKPTERRLSSRPTGRTDRLEVRVDPAAGRATFVGAVNKSDTTLHPPSRRIKSFAGMPLEIQLRPRKARTLDIKPGERPQFEADQEGTRRARGEVHLVIYEGEPLFAGSVTAGTADR
jgi:hypothetical protein